MKYISRALNGSKLPAKTGTCRTLELKPESFPARDLSSLCPDPEKTKFRISTSEQNFVIQYKCFQYNTIQMFCEKTFFKVCFQESLHSIEFEMWSC